MTDEDVSLKLMQGAKAWNVWREQNPGPIHCARPNWYDSSGPGAIQVKGRNRLNFSGMTLSDMFISSAFAEGLNLKKSIFHRTHFEEGDFSRADFRGAIFCDTKFNKTILTDAKFDGARFANCNLNRVNLVGASFCVNAITETVVYGIAAWDLQTCADMKQSKLVIEKTYELYSDLIQQGKVPMMVDNIELAQFVYYLTNHKRMRETLNILNERGVLLLGQFENAGLERLDMIRGWFQDRGYLAMIFDFARPDSLSLTETVVTMAGLSKFIVADLSGRSVPAELQAILAQIKKPVLAFGDPYALFPDVEDKTLVITIEGDRSGLMSGLEAKLPELERLYAKRLMQLAKRYAKGDKGKPLKP